MRQLLNVLPILAFSLLTIITDANGDQCSNYNENQCNTTGAEVCIWTGSTCTERCPTSDEESPTCTNWNGCYMDIYECQPCGPGTYNNTSDATSCTPCSSFSYSTGQTFDTTYANTYGLDTCPWVCTNGYFKSITNQSNNQAECLSCPDASHPKSYGTQDITNIGTCTCTNGTLIKTTESNVDKYYCGTCGVGTASSNNNITTCTCPATSNRVHGNQAYRTNNGPVECACPDGASWNSQSNKCVCTDTNKTIVLDNETGLYVCSSCSNSNATLYGNVCKCNAGYYGTIDGINTQCTECPIGTTTTIGATQRSECQMNHNTKFCYGSDDNKKCMHLIPVGTVISAPNNT
ncbi:MAG: hypothetical protein IKM94_05025 [Alphaproteobacteria bacterium]|nr:hypothetical protein [Alphaproteobacteria bacterium]